MTGGWREGVRDLSVKEGAKRHTGHSDRKELQIVGVPEDAFPSLPSEGHPA